MKKAKCSTVETSTVASLHDGKGPVFGGELWNRDQLGSGAWQFVHYWQIPVSASIGQHIHKTGRELYFIVAGHGTMHTNEEQFPVTAGDLILNEPGDTHGIVNDSDQELCILVTCVVEKD